MIVKAIGKKYVVWNGWNHTQLSKEFDTIQEAEAEMLAIEAREEMERLTLEQQNLKHKLKISS